MSMSSGRLVAADTTHCLSAGVRVYEWQPTTLHAKTFVVDG
jgi:phosphatidylserine/phosphatidylglycerophosphate/cardiolipin synthase-like enzyme